MRLVRVDGIFPFRTYDWSVTEYSQPARLVEQAAHLGGLGLYVCQLGDKLLLLRILRLPRDVFRHAPQQLEEVALVAAQSNQSNQSKRTREHVPGAGTNRRGLEGIESMFQGLEPIAGD